MLYKSRSFLNGHGLQVGALFLLSFNLLDQGFEVRHVLLVVSGVAVASQANVPLLALCAPRAAAIDEQVNTVFMSEPALSHRTLPLVPGKLFVI